MPPAAPRRRHLPAVLSLLALGACAPPPATGPTPVEEAPNEVRREVIRGGANEAGIVEYHPTTNKARVIDFRGTPDALWPRVLAAYQTLGLPLGEVDTRAHTAGTSSVRAVGRFAGAPISNFLDCGANALGTPAADTYVVTLQVATELRPSPVTTGTTTVRTLVSAVGKANGTQGDPVDCVSTGALETRLVRLVDPAAVSAAHQP